MAIRGIVEKISSAVDAEEEEIWRALAKLGYVERRNTPSLHWGITELGAFIYDVDEKGFLQLCEDVEDAICDACPPTGLQLAHVAARKVCGRCGIEKVAPHFGYSERNNDGLTRWCLSCLRRHNE